MSNELATVLANLKPVFRLRWANMIEQRGFNIEVAQFDPTVRSRHAQLWEELLVALSCDTNEKYFSLLEKEGRLQARAGSRVEALITQLTMIINLVWEVISSTPEFEASPQLLRPMTKKLNSLRSQAEASLLGGFTMENLIIEQERARESTQARQERLSKASLVDLVKSVSAFRMVRYRHEQLVFQPGDNRPTLYFILAGRIRVYEILPDARSITFSILGPGEVFAQSGARDSYFHDVYAEAMQDSTVAAIQENALTGLMEDSPLLASRIIDSFSQQLSQSQILIEGLIGRDVGLRLVSLLLKLATEFGVHQPKDEIKIEFDLTHQTLADMIGSNRVTVTRKLSLLQQKKLIRIDRGAVSILDHHALQEMVA